MKQPPLSKVLKIFFQLKWEESKNVLGWIGISVASALVLTFGVYWIGVGTFNLEAKIWYDHFPLHRMVIYFDRPISSARDATYDDFLTMEYKRTFNDDYFGLTDDQPLGWWVLGFCNLIKIIFVLSVLGGIGFGIIKFIKWIQGNWKQAKKIARMEM